MVKSKNPRVILRLLFPLTSDPQQILLTLSSKYASSPDLLTTSINGTVVQAPILSHLHSC